LHPAANPNLILSTDDNTLFVFKGSADNEEDWDWKLVDRINGDPSVQSDLEVGNDVANSGGFRVWVMVTFIASGLAALLHILLSVWTNGD